MYEFHKDLIKYFNIQYSVTKNYILPFIGIDNKDKLKVLEVGCGEAGVLKAFLELGHTAVGIELSAARAEIAKQFLEQEINAGQASIINKNIYDVDPTIDVEMKFDLIILKDVIEHIPDQQRFINKLHDLLLPDGRVFFAFPPWWMPFGGHQQICHNKFLSKLPWFHLLPAQLYKCILQLGKENENTIKELLEIKSTGILVEELYRYLQRSNFSIIKQKFWLINPIYLNKFSFKPLASLINIPYLRNIYCTAFYIVFESKTK